MNGDENDQGQRWRFSPKDLSIERCGVYRYEYAERKNAEDAKAVNIPVVTRLIN